MQSVSESLAGRVGIIEMLGLSNSELAGAANEAFVPSAEYFERRVSHMSPMTSGQIFERIASGSFPGIMTLELGAASDQFFESYVFGEVYKSYANAGQRAPLCFFRNNDRKEIDLLLEQNGTLYPIEVKQSANPADGDTRNFPALDPVASDDLPAELRAFHREIGMGAVVCLASDTYLVNRRAWGFPAWAI